MRPHALIVEDDEPLSIVLRYNLEAEGFAVTAAASAEEAELVIRASPGSDRSRLGSSGRSGIALPRPSLAAGDASHRDPASRRRPRTPIASAVSPQAQTSFLSSRFPSSTSSRAFGAAWHPFDRALQERTRWKPRAGFSGRQEDWLTRTAT